MGLQVHPEAKALIFDLDGTLSNSLPVHVKTWNLVGEKYGFKFDTNIIHQLTGRPTIEFARHIVERYGLQEDPQKIVELKQQWFWDFSNELIPVDEILEIVRSYRGKLPMAVGTGASRKSAEVQLNVLGIKELFDAIVSADDVQQHKPEPQTFLECARLIHVEPKHCQVFEDGDMGIQAAKTAGMMVTDIRPFIDYGNW